MLSGKATEGEEEHTFNYVHLQHAHILTQDVTYATVVALYITDRRLNMVHIERFLVKLFNFTHYKIGKRAAHDVYDNEGACVVRTGVHRKGSRKWNCPIYPKTYIFPLYTSYSRKK